MRQVIASFLQTLILLAISIGCFSQEPVYEKTMSYKQLVDEVMGYNGKRLDFRNTKFELIKNGEDSIFFKTYRSSDQVEYYYYEIADYRFPASVVFFDCSFDDRIRFRNCNFKNLEFVDCSMSNHFSFNICTFEGNLNFLACKGEDQNIYIDSSKFKRSLYVGFDSKLDQLFLANSVFDTTVFLITPYKEKFQDYFLLGKKSNPVQISSSKINFLEIQNCDFSIPDKDSITTLGITTSIIDDFNFLDNNLKSVNFNYSSFNNSVYFENINIQENIIFDGVNLPFYNTNITWDYLSGNKICLRQENSIYKAHNDEQLSDRVIFYDLISIYNKLYHVYKTRGDRNSANGSYVEMKDIESRRLRFLYSQNPSLNKWFNWRLNQFLKFFCDYGTSPIKSLIISMYTILGFALFYFFFYSKWDKINIEYLIKKHKKLIRYFMSEQRLEELYAHDYKSELRNQQAYLHELKASKNEVPRFIHFLGIPLYYLSNVNYKMKSWFYKRVEILSGKWADLKPGKKRSVGVISFLIIIAYLFGIVIMRLLNSIVLSINTFSTLGFGDIPVKGITRYIAIFEGFLGWFLLSIFSVSLISQILQN